MQPAGSSYAVRFEVHMAATMKICVFFDVALCSLTLIYQVVSK